MIDSLQIIVLSLVQGVTEFLPVSSSAHLILVPALLGWSDQGLAFDIAVHVGTLIAVLAYFRKELQKMMVDFCASPTKPLTSEARLMWSIGFATIPVGLCGLAVRNFHEHFFRSTSVIAVATIGFGLMLWGADKWSKHNRAVKDIHWCDVLIIGLFQILSLIPGTSRSGITLTGGLFRNLTREAAARFSFLMSIPVILLAASLEVVKLIKAPISVDWYSLGLGMCLSAISGYVCIHVFINLLNKIGVLPFVLYRLALGVFLLIYFY